jgi:arginine decarboxylase
MRQSDLPLLEALHRYKGQAPSSYHVPGHKSGVFLSKLEGTSDSVVYDKALIFKTLLNIDITEITGLDDLHEPSGVIAEAQALAADCFGADHTFFLVNGSTVGNLSLILTVCEPGDLIILSRNVHKSVIHGLMLAGAKAVFLPANVDASTGFSYEVYSQHLKEALEQYPQAKAVFLTNPNYYGLTIDLESIAQLVHEYNIPLLVDEAHGAHFGIHPKLPKSALACGADGVVQSTHKMLTAMTMGSMLHIQGARLDVTLVKQRLSMLQSSSPSYPIMASLDLARWLIIHYGYAWAEDVINEIEAFKIWVKDETHFGIWDNDDPFKIMMFDRTGSLSGYELQQALEARGCYIEMADPENTLILLSLASTKQDIEKLVENLKEIQLVFRLKEQEIEAHFTNKVSRLEYIKQLKLSKPVHFHLSQWKGHKNPDQTTLVLLENAIGECSAEMIIPYPPGIPVLLSGETITKEIVVYLKKCADMGARFQDAYDSSMQSVLIYKSN